MIKLSLSTIQAFAQVSNIQYKCAFIHVWNIYMDVVIYALFDICLRTQNNTLHFYKSYLVPIYLP